MNSIHGESTSTDFINLHLNLKNGVKPHLTAQENDIKLDGIMKTAILYTLGRKKTYFYRG